MEAVKSSMEEENSAELTAVDAGPNPNPNPSTPDGQVEELQNLKRKRSEEAAPDPFWKTSLCSYFRRRSQDCRHGDNCRYAHSEQELRPRPDDSWDPTSERAKKLLRKPEKTPEEKPELCSSENSDGSPEKGERGSGLFNKWIINLPEHWGVVDFKKLLGDLELPFTNARKKSGMGEGFVCFSSEEHVTLATEKLNGKSINKRYLKVVDVLPRPWEEEQINVPEQGETDDQDMDDPDAFCSKQTNSEIKSPVDSEVLGDGNLEQNNHSASDRSVIKLRSARDAVTPLANMPYEQQLTHKKTSMTQILKRLTRNARKTCPSELPLPEWILSAKNRGGLPCTLEGILPSPLINGYRNKCEFTVGLSRDGERVVGFLLGNFREGMTAVEEPTNCPNVSAIACQYASAFQKFIRSSPLPVWNKHQTCGFWRLFTVREGRAQNRVSDSGTEQPKIAEVMLIAQVCSKGVEEDSRSSEFKRMAEALALAAASASPPLPLTALFVQDHLDISNAAPFDAPLFPIPLPKVVEGGNFEDECKEPEGQIHDYISNLRFSISPTAFFQVNTVAAERLYSLAGDWAALSPTTLLFDICCGTGTIGLTLAHRAGLVVGIEMSAPAVADAQRNAEINGIKNCKFVCAKAEDVIDSLLKEYLEMPAEMASDISDNAADKNIDNISKKSASEYGTQGNNSPVSGNDTQIKGDTIAKETEQIGNISSKSPGTSTETNEFTENKKEANIMKRFREVVVIVDPPRCGLHPVVTKALRTQPWLRRLVYISCNPETLVANAIELCTPSTGKVEKIKGRRGGYRHMGNAGHARQRAKSMPVSEPFCPVKAMAVDLFPHTPHCEMVMLLER